VPTNDDRSLMNSGHGRSRALASFALLLHARAYQDDPAPRQGERDGHLLFDADNPVVLTIARNRAGASVAGRAAAVQTPLRAAPTLSVEPVWRFYPNLTWDFIVKQARFAYTYWRLYRIYRAVAAIAPVVDEEEEEESFELFSHNQSARDAVDHLRRVKALTAGVP